MVTQTPNSACLLVIVTQYLNTSDSDAAVNHWDAAYSSRDCPGCVLCPCVQKSSWHEENILT